jgi:hypothetical protein
MELLPPAPYKVVGNAILKTRVTVERIATLHRMALTDSSKFN